MPVDPPPDPLTAALATIEPRTATDRTDRDRLVAAAAQPGPWDRSTPLHMTASAIVVHPPTERVLLRWHDRHEAWMQVGGHGDPGETDPFSIALREAEEETGLPDLRPWPTATPAIIQAVIVPVPANEQESAHEHGDLRFVLATESPEAVVPESDRTPLQWLSVGDALDLVAEENLRENIRRVGELLG